MDYYVELVLPTDHFRFSNMNIFVCYCRSIRVEIMLLYSVGNRFKHFKVY
jgi:hypothetical protein